MRCRLPRQATEKLGMLEQAREKSVQVLTQEAYNPYKSGAPRIVDIRVSQLLPAGPTARPPAATRMIAFRPASWQKCKPTHAR